MQSGLQLSDLESIYRMCDMDNDGFLDLPEFTAAIHIVMTCRFVSGMAPWLRVGYSYPGDDSRVSGSYDEEGEFRGGVCG